ncbi:MAG: TIM-barrel domain-containing protein [Baekduiaceae bacterium]
MGEAMGRRACIATAVCAWMLAALVSGAPAARADVSIGPDRVVVRTPSMSATVVRATGHLSFADASGAPLLAQVPLRGVPRRLTGVDPKLLGFEALKDRGVYAPFAYEVGSSRRSQFTTGIWSGNLLLGVRTGVVHGARSVIEAEAAGDGVRVVLATTEPGRRLEVLIGPDPASPAALRVQAGVTPRDRVIALGDSFVSGDDERFFGFGGRHNALSQRGRTFNTWVEAQNYGAGALQPLVDAIDRQNGPAYLFPNGANAAYYPQSLFVSSRPYGFFADNGDVVRWRMASDRPDAWQVSAEGSRLDYTVAPGRGAAAAAHLSAINGRHRLPPAWAQGAMLSRTVRIFGQDTPASYERRVLADVAEIERRNVPITSYKFEGFAVMPRPVVVDVIRRLRARGVRSVLYLRAFTSKDNALTESLDAYAEALREGYVVNDASGRPVTWTTPFGARGALLDFTNPRTVAWWEGRVRELLDLGADGFMLDFGEQVIDRMRFHDGTPGAKMHNRYPALMHQVTREIADRWSAEHPDRDVPFFFTRAGSSGRPGAAAHEMANFAGDGSTDWHIASGLPAQTTDMLNRAVGGAWGFSTDIGGYADYVTTSTSSELFVRWSQWAAFTPYFRVHNSSRGGLRMPWFYGDRVYGLWRDAAALHDRAVPLIRRLWAEAERGGPPPLRPLWMAAPDEPQAAGEQQAWMLGDDLLVAPVVTKGARTRTVYLPEGCWQLQPDGASYEGGRRVTVAAPLERLPWFVRCATNPLG